VLDHRCFRRFLHLLVKDWRGKLIDLAFGSWMDPLGQVAVKMI